MRYPVNPPFDIRTEFREPTSTALFGIHAGLDFAVEIGTDVHAPVSGTVTDYTWGVFHGNVVQIFDGRYYHRLMHNSAILVRPGDYVSEGEVVAKSGATGKDVTGPHVHYDVSPDKVPASFTFIDPDSLLKGEPMNFLDSTITTKEEERQVFLAWVGRNPLPQEIGRYVGKTVKEVWPDIAKNATRLTVDPLFAHMRENGGKLPDFTKPDVKVNGVQYAPRVA